MHHDKLKKCDARKLPKWLVDYMRPRQSKSLIADIAAEERLGKQPDGPSRDTRSYSKDITKQDENYCHKSAKAGTEKGTEVILCVKNKTQKG